ncbi:battenin CLN3 protein [Rhizina undulata]
MNTAAMEDPTGPSAHAYAAPRTGSRSPFSLPVPGAPASTFAAYKASFYAAFAGADPRVCAAFWIFGLINNVLYVIILSAALDLVGPTLPKAIVLLADVVPSFLTKLSAPYFVHLLPYRMRILLLVFLSFAGMQFVAWAPDLPLRLFGVVLASVSSGLGELSFLGMTHFYGPFAVPFWSSGTGAAGLAGAGMYVIATTWMRWGVRSSLMVFGFLPAGMLVAFFLVLPLRPLAEKRQGYDPIVDYPEEEEEDTEPELLAQGGRVVVAVNGVGWEETWRGLKIKLKKTKHLFLPYMAPLLLVYIAEYTINLGVSPTLLFPLSNMPFTHYRDAYPMYNTLYQLGVFISRSSTPFIRIHHLYSLTILQCANLLLLILHAMFNFLPNIYVVFAIVFWEGLLGGAVYVNTFAEISEKVAEGEREFSLGVVTVGDSGGICVAGMLSLWLEGTLCGWQVSRGREYCRLT